MGRHRKKMNRSDVMRAQRIFRKLTQTHSAEGETIGIIDFYYTDFANASEGVYNHNSDISELITHLEGQGLIMKIHRGVKDRPSRWDVRNLLALDFPQIEVAIVEEPDFEPTVIPKAPIDKHEQPKELKTVEEAIHFIEAEQARYANPVVVELEPEQRQAEAEADNAEVTIAVVNDTIKEMVTYMQESQREMTKYLGSLIEKMALGDPEVAKNLHTQLIQVASERDRAVAEAQHLHEELHKKPEVTINAHMVVRSLHKILDETERWIATPGWQKSQRADHFRQSIQSFVEEIKNEVVTVGAQGDE